MTVLRAYRQLLRNGPLTRLLVGELVSSIGERVRIAPVRWIMEPCATRAECRPDRCPVIRATLSVSRPARSATPRRARPQGRWMGRIGKTPITIGLVGSRRSS